MKMKRTLSLLLSLVLLLSVLSPATAYAEGNTYVATNGFVLCHAGEGNTAWEYFSPFVPAIRYNNLKGDYTSPFTDGGPYLRGFGILFGLKNEYNDTIIKTAYCTDLPVDTDATYYQRINLADSTYAAQQANRLRAIILGGYPETELAELQKLPGLAGLTKHEAVNGTQLAIWQVAHGSDMKILDFMYEINGAYTSSAHATEAIEEANAYRKGTDAYKAAVESRIETLYNYLLGLAPKTADRVVASEASFVSRSEHPTVSVSGDTCTITVNTTVNVQLNQDDSLTLTAYIKGGQYYAQTALKNGSNSYILTIENVPVSLQNETVTLAIDGTQSSSDEVFLLDAKGIRGASQSMIGVVDGTLPVHAQVNVEPDRVLDITKLDQATKEPLANVTFEIYFVGEMSDYLNGRLSISSTPTDADITKYAVGKNLVATITTDANGHASFNFGTNSDGVYLVKEIANEVIEKPVDPFFISVPMYDSKGNVKYVIDASPKNSVTTEEVDIDKDVTSLGNQHDTFDVGQEHTWIISTTLPKSLASGQSYVISDTLDYRLTFHEISKVTLENVDGTETLMELKENSDYVVDKTTVTDSENREVDHFTVSLTTAGMKKVAEKAGDNYQDCRLRVYFTAEINTNAGMGVDIPNHADVDYTNKVGKHFKDTSDQPEVHTGAATLLKVDAKDETKVLSGAVFEVYRLDENGDVELTIDGEKKMATKVSFYDNPELSGNKVDSLTTGEDGKGYIYGLAYGTYYLVETKAPDGYHVRTEPYPIEITATSHKAEPVSYTLINSTDVLLPGTGGIGTYVFTIGGLCLMSIAVVLLIRNRKKQHA